MLLCEGKREDACLSLLGKGDERGVGRYAFYSVQLCSVVM